MITPPIIGLAWKQFSEEPQAQLMMLSLDWENSDGEFQYSWKPIQVVSEHSPEVYHGKTWGSADLKGS